MAEPSSTQPRALLPRLSRNPSYNPCPAPSEYPLNGQHYSQPTLQPKQNLPASNGRVRSGLVDQKHACSRQLHSDPFSDSMGPILKLYSRAQPSIVRVGVLTPK